STPILRADPERRPTVAVYDIQVTLPGELPLERFRFDSGRFELVFGDRRKRLTLWRWSPADIALRHHDGALLNFARKSGLPLTPGLAAVPRPVPQGLEWRWPVKRSRFIRLPRRRKRRLPPGIFRIWHRTVENRILAARGDGDLDYETFVDICRGYEIIS
nr:hypothetical protein [Desulfobacterales bacterium]